jgi:hypothetical protein
VVVLAVAEWRRSLPTLALKTDEGSRRAGLSCWRRRGRSWRREADAVFFSSRCAESGPIWVWRWQACRCWLGTGMVRSPLEQTLVLAMVRW